MKAKIPILCACILLLTATIAQATLNINIYEDTVIQPGDEFNIVRIYDNATVGMTGGSMGTFQSMDTSTMNLFDGHIVFADIFDESRLYMYGGQIDNFIYVKGSSIVSIFGGKIGGFLDIYDSGIVKFYGYGFQWEPDINATDRGYLSGYLKDNTPFEIYLRRAPGPFPGSHIVLIPEPGTLLILTIGALMIASAISSNRVTNLQELL